MFKKNDLVKTLFGVIAILSLAACASQTGTTDNPASYHL